MESFLKIGNVKIKKTAALAPMASVADTAYRLMCKKFGAALVFSEMISVKGIFFNPEKSEKYLNITPKERPMAIQLFGEDPKYFELALPKVLQYAPDIVDINMGCPVNKVVKTGAGCALMKNIELATKIAATVVKHCNVPVTVKLRKGWDTTNVCEFAKRLQDVGISAITIHGRTRKDMFTGQADWQIIREVKKSLSIPVIANGDIKNAEQAKKAYEITNADLIMIGRGSFGQPFIFKQISDFLKTGTQPKTPNIFEILNTMLTHIKLICKFEGEEKGIKKARAQATRYFNNFKNAKHIRQICNKLNTMDDILKLKEKILNTYEN